MKGKLLLSMMVVVLSVALIAGGTGAWFTAETEAPTADFTAGTVQIEVTPDEEFQKMPEGKYFDNVAPGDCARVNYIVENIGSLDAMVRVKLYLAWLDGDEVDGTLDTRAVRIAPKTPGWVMVDPPVADDGDIWLYYVDPLKGNYDPDPEDEAAVTGDSVGLTLVLGFDGESIDDNYQGKTFRIMAEFNAIQAANGAPEAVWGSQGLTAALAASDFYTGDPSGRAVLYGTYFQGENPGASMPCWTGHQEPDPEPEPDKYTLEILTDPEDAGSVTGSPEGEYEAGTDIALTAEAADGYTFAGWDVVGTTDYNENGNELTFTMPASDVTVTAKFEEEVVPPQEFTLEIKRYKRVFVDPPGPTPGYWTYVESSDGGRIGIGSIGGPTSGQYTAGSPVTLKADPNRGWRLAGWSTTPNESNILPGSASYNSNEATYNYTMPGNNVTLYAIFYE